MNNYALLRQYPTKFFFKEELSHTRCTEHHVSYIFLYTIILKIYYTLYTIKLKICTQRLYYSSSKFSKFIQGKSLLLQ